MASLVDAQEAEVAVLSDFAVLFSVGKEWLVTGGSELFAICIVDLKRECFAAEPIAYVIGITNFGMSAFSLTRGRLANGQGRGSKAREIHQIELDGPRLWSLKDRNLSLTK